MKVSVICCYTNEDMFNEVSVYVNKQNMASDIEIIGVDNRAKAFPSASKALNYGSGLASGEVLVWLHQDLMMIPNDGIEQIYDYLMNNDKTLVGVAGMQRRMDGITTAITETREMIRRYNNVISVPTEVQTLDECLLAMRKSDWEENKFDEKVCDNWHLYGVEMSLRIGLSGGRVMCLPIAACHLSMGNVNDSYYNGLRKVIKKYSGRVDYVYTTCVSIKVSIFSIDKIIIRRKLSKIKHAILGK